MHHRLPYRLLLGAALALSTATLAVSTEDLKAFVDGRAPGGASFFFTLDVARTLRGALLLLGPCVAALPFLMRALAKAPVDSTAGGRGTVVVEVFLVVAFVLSGLARLHLDPPLTKDTKFYLSESLEVASNGGPLALFGQAFRGEYKESNRHPLYPGALAVVAEESDRFTDRARVLSLAGAALALLLVMRAARHRLGSGAGLFVGVLLVTSGVFREQAVQVACESWWMVFALLWFQAASADDPGRGLRHQALAGAFVGLAYLTKGTGTLLVLAHLAHLGWTRRARAGGAVVVFLAGFTLVALPLLWRNTAVFGNPVYNVNSSKVLWLDSWKQFEDPAAMEAAGPLHYLETHSTAEIASRVAVGLVKELVHLLEVFSPISPSAGLGLPLLLLCLACTWRDPVPHRRSLLLILFAVFFAAFTWYAKVVQGWRFLGALVPLLLFPAAVLWQRAGRSASSASGLKAVASMIALALGGHAVWSGALHFRMDRFDPTPETGAVHAFLREHAGGDHVHYLLGPDDHLTRDWDREVRGTRHPFPRDAAGYAELMAGRYGENVRFALVAEPDEGRAPGVEATWYRAGSGGLSVGSPPPEWTLVRALPPSSPRVLIFERASPPR